MSAYVLVEVPKTPSAYLLGVVGWLYLVSAWEKSHLKWCMWWLTWGCKRRAVPEKISGISRHISRWWSLADHLQSWLWSNRVWKSQMDLFLKLFQDDGVDVKSKRQQKIWSILLTQFEGRLTETWPLLLMTSNTQQSTTFGCHVSKSISPQPTLKAAICFAPL